MRKVKLTETDIQTIVNQPHLVVRNLQITQGYYRLSQGMQSLIGRRNVSWCSFATHASKTAGQALRHELMPRLLKSAMIRMAGYDNTFFYLNDALVKQTQTLNRAGKSRLAEALAQVSLLISAGNVLVFRELAGPFLKLINTFYRDWEYDQEKLQAFLHQHLQSGPLAQGGQDHLFEAFTAYYNARFETNRKRKAEYVLQANLLIGLHEQTRLQPHIERALAVPLNLFAESAGDDEDPDDLTPGRAGQPGRSGGLSREMVTRLATRMMMSITLPSRELKLSEDVIAPTGVISFPQDLVDIESSRCRALVAQFTAGRDTLTGSAARNWASLADRMSFVAAFFRSHQQYKRLFEQPFLDSQVAAIDAGHIPAGPL